MALTDFFRINLPYGITNIKDDQWFVFNREYLPLGWNDKSKQQSIFDENSYSEFPVHTKYDGLTERAILKIIKDSEAIQRDENGKLKTIFFYNDGRNPKSNPEHWNNYFKIIKAFSKFEKSDYPYDKS
ncbi:MAG: hypothetical protein ACK4NY_18035 [Spirosomataceae bacterium]